MDDAIEKILKELKNSKFRSSFKLKGKELKYALDKGDDLIRKHAAEFITNRLASADIPNDGKQTPFKNHPVFIAQHATATCCRKCLNKWHNIPAGRKLSEEEILFTVNLITAWIKNQINIQINNNSV